MTKEPLNLLHLPVDRIGRQNRCAHFFDDVRDIGFALTLGSKFGAKLVELHRIFSFMVLGDLAWMPRLGVRAPVGVRQFLDDVEDFNEVLLGDVDDRAFPDELLEQAASRKLVFHLSRASAAGTVGFVDALPALSGRAIGEVGVDHFPDGYVRIAQLCVAATLVILAHAEEGGGLCLAWSLSATARRLHGNGRVLGRARLCLLLTPLSCRIGLLSGQSGRDQCWRNPFCGKVHFCGRGCGSGLGPQ